jgi:hypothetical protein
MARRKYPSELSTKQIRVSLGDYALLAEISRRAGVTFAEALHLALERQEAVTRVSGAQIPMPVFQVAPMPVIAVNGSKQAAFKIKPKGGVIHE